MFGPQLLIGVAAVGFVPKAIGAADGIKGTFAYLIGDSFAKLGLGMIADGTPVFGLTGWAGTFAALDAAAVGCICLMAIVAIFEERKIRREKRTVFCRPPDSLYLVTLPGLCAGLFISCALCRPDSRQQANSHYDSQAAIG